MAPDTIEELAFQCFRKGRTAALIWNAIRHMMSSRDDHAFSKVHGKLENGEHLSETDLSVVVRARRALVSEMNQRHPGLGDRALRGPIEDSMFLPDALEQMWQAVTAFGAYLSVREVLKDRHSAEMLAMSLLSERDI